MKEETPASDSMMLKGGNTIQEKIEWLLSQLTAKEAEIKERNDYYEKKIELLDRIYKEATAELKYYRELAAKCLPYIEELQCENNQEPSVGYDNNLAELFNDLKNQNPE